MDFQILPTFFQGDPITALIFPAALFFNYVTDFFFFFSFLKVFSLSFLKREKGKKEVDVFGKVRDLKCWNFFLLGHFTVRG